MTTGHYSFFYIIMFLKHKTSSLSKNDDDLRSGYGTRKHGTWDTFGGDTSASARGWGPARLNMTFLPAAGRRLQPPNSEEQRPGLEVLHVTPEARPFGQRAVQLISPMHMAFGKREQSAHTDTVYELRKK